MSRGTRTLAVLLAVAAGTSCGRPSTPFSVTNARAHVTRLAGDIGARPAGSDANRRAREYVVEQLRFFGFSVRVQEADAVRPEHGLTARVQNVIAVLPGAIPDAIGLVAHYDSVPIAPGAGDDALGVAVCLEAGRLLASRKAPRHSVMVLLTDAEENGLMGAAALVTDPEVRSRLRTYINVEATGSDGPAMLFETGPGNAWLVRAFAEAAPAPRGGSLGFEIYKRLPNDTDFSILRSANVPGLNIAAIGDSYAYHTPRDVPERLTDDVLEQAGANVLATVLALDHRNLSTRTDEQAVYFDLLSRRTMVLSPFAAAMVGVAAIVLGLAGWVRTAITAWRTCGPGACLRTAAWVIFGAVVVSVAVIGATALLRAVREVYHPWYAHPGRLWLLLVLTAVAAAHVVAALVRRLPTSFQAVRHPALAWAIGLPAWLLLAVAAQRAAPGAAYLWTVPLAVAGAVTMTAAPATGMVARLAAMLVLATTGALWLPDTRDLLRFAVPLFGRLPIVTPVAVLPGALLGCGLMLAVPLAALLAARGPGERPVGGIRRAPAIVISALWLALTVSFAWCYTADAYTRERPLWRYARYVADHASGRAAWEVAGNEPGLDLHPGAGAPRGWRLASGAPLPGVPVAPSPHPFAFRASVAPGPPPLTASGTMNDTDTEVQVQVRATAPAGGPTVLFTLPPGVVPIRSSLPGRVRDGWWTAAYAAPPPGLVVFTAAFHHADAARVPGMRAGIVTSALPGGTGWTGQPGWLPSDRFIWFSRAIELVPIEWTGPE